MSQVNMARKRALIVCVALMFIPLALFPENSRAQIYAEQVAQADFVITVNGLDIIRSTEISPPLPIMMSFRHKNPDVKMVRMQHPGNPQFSLTMKVGQEYRITNHEDHMKAGHVSTSEFLALDNQGNVYDKITISFVP